MKIKDPALLQQLHLRWKECVLCHGTYGLTLHHISKHPRNDMEGNLVMLCMGPGTLDCHSHIEGNDHRAMRELGAYILKCRPDAIIYLYEELGPVAAQDWMRRHLLFDAVSLAASDMASGSP